MCACEENFLTAIVKISRESSDILKKVRNIFHDNALNEGPRAPDMYLVRFVHLDIGIN